MAVLLEKVMLDFPDSLEPQLVRKLDLLERVAEKFFFGPGFVWTWQLVLVKQAEAHRAHTTPIPDDRDPTPSIDQPQPRRWLSLQAQQN